jgi:predicted CXXCH cytochrome family protein
MPSKIRFLRLTTPLGITFLAAAALGAACGTPSNDGGPLASSDAGADVTVDAADGASAPLPPLEATPPAIIAPANRLDAASSSVVVDGKRGGVWVANGDVGTISYVDPDARTVVREIPIGSGATTDIRSIALSPDFAWIAAVDRGGASVSLVDADTGVVARSIPLGTHPRAAVWDSADPRWLYVAVEDDGAVAIVDRTNGVLTTEIPVGRLPSGVAVSRQRREVYVTHRIDGMVSIVDLATRADVDDVPLAVEPANTDPTVPQGTPFAFESPAWAPDGNTVWLPHELLAPTHPFQFRETLFPTISVADMSMRAEVQTNPDDPNGIIAGRKNLFDAIQLFDTAGNPIVLSQPCAAAFHPAGFVAFALACASEDLLVFDAVTGIATDIIRSLPGDHPTGITLDPTGARGFIVSDQSHTLLEFDTAQGNPTLHATLLGAPIALVATDPVAPALRAGLEVFYNANSSKYAYDTTSNNWMSCGGCHLDGFVSTNKFFFDTLTPVNAAVDAQIGHVGLVDLFSTAPTPTDPSFNPHDILVAFRDMGGLDPDRTGTDQSMAIDPGAVAPPADVVQMAQSVAQVVERDLPLGPSWLLDQSAPLNPAYDGQWCGNCHQAEYAAWSQSVHSHSANDPMMSFCAGVEQGLRGKQFSRQCAGCHDPVSARLGDTTLTTKKSITCLGCHDVTREIQAGGNSDLQASSHDWTQDHKASATAALTTLRDPKFCGGCHKQFVPGNGLLPAFNTLTEWEASPYATGATQTLCVDCHMAKTNGVADHRAPGGNLYIGQRVGDPTLIADETANLTSFITLSATTSGSNATVDVYNKGSGHGFPTGVSDVREAWVELQAVDEQGNALAHYGGPAADGTIPSDAARLGTDVASADGTVLLQHELSSATSLPYDKRVMPHEHVDFTLAVPASTPAGTTEIDAVLYYRNLRTTYYRLALDDAGAVAPQTELARVKVQ